MKCYIALRPVTAWLARCRLDMSVLTEYISRWDGPWISGALSLCYCRTDIDMFLFRKKQSDRPLLVDDSNLPVEAPTPVVGGGPALIAYVLHPTQCLR